MENQEYQEAIENLYLQAPSYQVVGDKAYHPGLATMLEFDKTLGHPHKEYKTIHIAGTNGKGSVSHILASVLSSCGKKVGLYTSPHLIDFRERIKIVSDKTIMIPKKDVLLFLKNNQKFINEKNPSFFEITTAMAFDFFAKENVDIAIIETGLGGRLDSTNIITPILSVITSIGKDHTNYLGDTLSKIAFEKAGIIKEGVPVVLGEMPSDVLGIFEEKAAQTHSAIYTAAKQSKDLENSFLENMDLKGEYQRMNLRTLFTVLEVIKNEFPEIKETEKLKKAIFSAASFTGLRGRWEVLSTSPRIICDIAHNEQGLIPVMRQLKNIYDTSDYSRLIIIWGMMADKDVRSISKLLPEGAYYYFTNAEGQRALPAAELKEKLGDRLEGEVVASVAEAIKGYMKISKSDDLVYIGGSSYVVAQALEYLELYKII